MGPLSKIEGEMGTIRKIISGGQTGVDRAALDIALELGIACGGWCPKGRKAEDGPIDSHYPLQETASTSYSVRTKKNVMDSDGILILTWGPVTGGTARTLEFAKKYEKPYLVIDLSISREPNSAMKWFQLNQIKILNVAGPREGKIPGIYDHAVNFLRRLFS